MSNVLELGVRKKSCEASDVLCCPIHFENQLTKCPCRLLVLSQILLWKIWKYSWLRLDLLSSQEVRLMCAQNLISSHAESSFDLFFRYLPTFISCNLRSSFLVQFLKFKSKFFTHLPISYCTALSFLFVRSAIAGTFFPFVLPLDLLLYLEYF